jgi:hypothetical protein
MFLTPALERESFESFVPGGEVPRLPPQWCFPLPPPRPPRLGMVFCSSLASASGVFVFLQPLGLWSFLFPLDPVVVVVPRQKTKRYLGWEATFWCVFPAESLT